MLLPINRKMFRHFFERRVTVTWEDNFITKNSPTSSSFSLILLLSMPSYVMKYPFGQPGSAVLAVSPLSLLPTCSILAGGAVRDNTPCCVINTLLVTNPKLSTIWTATKENYFILNRHSTIFTPHSISFAAYLGLTLSNKSSLSTTLHSHPVIYTQI